MTNAHSQPSSRPPALPAERPARGAAALLALHADGQAPEWIMLIPQGRVIVGRDRRSFTVSDPSAVIEATKAQLPLPVDYMHDFETRRPGDDTPAAGWIEALEAREGAIWGQVAWTPKAARAIAEREYRFISPAFLHTADAAAEIIRLCSAGLVHRPNFLMPALNNQQEPAMDQELLKALGLDDKATPAEAIAAIHALQMPSPVKFVPRADYDAVLSRATNAEQQLAALKTAQDQVAAEALIDKAIHDRKIAPASRAHYLKLALNSRADIEALLGTMPAIIPAGEDKSLAAGDPAAGSSALSPEEKAMCQQLGLTEEAFLKARG